MGPTLPYGSENPIAQTSLNRAKESLHGNNKGIHPVT